MAGFAIFPASTTCHADATSPVAPRCAERSAILQELEPNLLPLSKSPYGRFVISKMVDLATKEQLAGGCRGWKVVSFQDFGACMHCLLHVFCSMGRRLFLL